MSFMNHVLWHNEILSELGAIVRICIFWLVLNELSFSCSFINNISLSKLTALLCMSFSIIVSFKSSWEVPGNLKILFTISFIIIIIFLKKTLLHLVTLPPLIFMALATAWVFKGGIQMILKFYHIPLIHNLQGCFKFIAFWWPLRHSFHPRIRSFMFQLF